MDSGGSGMAGALPDGPWLGCPWCGGAVPLGHLVPADEEPGALVAVCGDCGRRVSFVQPAGP